MMAASHYKLDNMLAIVDYNKLQITGPVETVCNIKPIRDKLEAFGWHVEEADGHNLAEMERVFASIPFKKGKPSIVIAHTIKGKGVSFMENNYVWHHKVPSDSEYSTALDELKLS